MSSRLQLDVGNLSLERRHLVNAYKVKAGIGVIAGKTVWSMSERMGTLVLQKQHYINTLTFTYLSLYIRPPSATVVSAEPFSHGTGTLRCLQKEMATYRHWSVSLWRDPDDVSHCWILYRQNWMAAYLGYTLRMRTLFRGWPIMVNDTHTRRRLYIIRQVKFVTLIINKVATTRRQQTTLIHSVC